MECITGRDTVQGISRHILQNSATEGNIDDLHALADPDHGDPGGNGCVKGLKLQDVQFGVNSTGTFVFFSEESRSDISAARQNQGITGGDFPRDQCGYGSGGKFRKKRLIIARLGFASQND